MARTAILPLALVGALALAGCTATTPDAADGTVRVVASTNVYGSIAEAIGGDNITVTSLITSAAQDPHSYEASVQDQLALSKADLVIENGGGYDPFIDTLLEASGATPVVITAVDASGLLDDTHAHDGEEESDTETGEGDDHAEEIDGEHEGHAHIEGFNEHVWYSLHGTIHIAEEITHQLTELDAANADLYEANLATFTDEVSALETQSKGLEGGTVILTEPVPAYLLGDSNFVSVSVSAQEFSKAIEDGTDVPPAVLAETLNQIENGVVALLAYNSQTASSETEQVRKAAVTAGVPVVEFTETLPDGADYVSWMTDNLSAISAALG